MRGTFFMEDINVDYFLEWKQKGLFVLAKNFP